MVDNLSPHHGLTIFSKSFSQIIRLTSALRKQTLEVSSFQVGRYDF
jgi:hypothetical protein